jgi:hypothetical protein
MLQKAQSHKLISEYVGEYTAENRRSVVEALGETKGKKMCSINWKGIHDTFKERDELFNVFLEPEFIDDEAH